MFMAHTQKINTACLREGQVEGNQLVAQVQQLQALLLPSPQHAQQVLPRPAQPPLLPCTLPPVSSMALMVLARCRALLSKLRKPCAQP